MFDQNGIRFALEAHPAEIAYDIYTAERTLEALNHRQTFGFNFDPSHFVHQLFDPVNFINAFPERIYHVHVKDSRRRLDGRRSLWASHLNFGESERGWDFVSPGRGDVDFDALFRALNRIGYDGPLSIEWEDSGMEREWGAKDALAFVRRMDFAPSKRAFDESMQREAQTPG